jgi:hypothetical protein
MAANPQRRRLGGKARRALDLLIDRQDSSEAYLIAYLGFTDRMLFLLAQAVQSYVCQFLTCKLVLPAVAHKVKSIGAQYVRHAYTDLDGFAEDRPLQPRRGEASQAIGRSIMTETN